MQIANRLDARNFAVRVLTGPYSNRFGKSAPDNDSFRTATTSRCSTTSSTLFGRLCDEIVDQKGHLHAKHVRNLLFFHPWLWHFNTLGGFAGTRRWASGITRHFSGLQKRLHFPNRLSNNERNLNVTTMLFAGNAVCSGE